MPKPLSVWFMTSCGKFFKRRNTRPCDPKVKNTHMHVKKQQLELDMEQWTGSKLGKEYVKAVYCHPSYLTYIQSTSWETRGGRKHKRESRLQGEISLASGMQMTHPYERKKRGKNLLMKVKKKNEKAGLNLNIQRTKIMASCPIISWQIDGKQWKQWEIFILGGGFQSHCRWWLQPWN